MPHVKEDLGRNSFISLGTECIAFKEILATEIPLFGEAFLSFNKAFLASAQFKFKNSHAKDISCNPRLRDSIPKIASGDIFRLLLAVYRLALPNFPKRKKTSSAGKKLLIYCLLGRKV